MGILSRLAAIFRRRGLRVSTAALTESPDPTAHPPPTDSVDAQIAYRLLSGIDPIDWSALEHAYGPATTTPAYLRALLSPDEAVRAEAVEHLWSAITHQGTVYSATAAATPFLLRILADDAGKPIRAPLLSVLEVIAGGTSYHDGTGVLGHKGPDKGPIVRLGDAKRPQTTTRRRSGSVEAPDVVVKWYRIPEFL